MSIFQAALFAYTNKKLVLIKLGHYQRRKLSRQDVKKTDKRGGPISLVDGKIRQKLAALENIRVCTYEKRPRVIHLDLESNIYILDNYDDY